MKNKQTAVDYLKEKFITIHWFLVRDEISRSYADELLKKSFEQAKEMEKEQIIDAVNYGAERFGDISEQYYQEKYGIGH